MIGQGGDGRRYFVDPRFTDPELEPIADWMPARYTLSLTGTEDFHTDADRLLEVVVAHWRTPEVDRFLADPWQVWLLRHMLELYPPDWPVASLRGQLRYRQVVVSVGRQNGKSVLGALLAFYFLTMHKRGPRVVGVASVDRQARIVYDRVKYAVDESPALRNELKATASRGIKLRNGGGVYQTLPAIEDSAQGEPISGALYDELHLGNAGLWDALVLGQRAQRHSMLVGITTAGDDDSDLLVRLYGEGQDAIDYSLACTTAGAWTGGDDERFGFFVWEADSDELTEANLIKASPAIACGRVDLATAMADARKLWKAPADKSGVLGRDRCIRYVLNRFVAGSANSWASLKAFKAGKLVDDQAVEHGDAVVYSLERTDSWEWGSVEATSRRADGIFVTELVASLESPTHELFVDIGAALATRPRAVFAVDAKTMGPVGKALRDLGHEVYILTAGEMEQAAAAAKATIARRSLKHPGDPILSVQMSQARRRDLGDSWRISRTLSTGDVDAIIALVAGVHVASTRADRTMQLF